MSSNQQFWLNELRRAFDQSFAEEAGLGFERQKDRFIYFSMLDERYAINALHLSGFAKAGPLTHLPARTPGLLGISSVRGQLVPVFSLAPFLKINQPAEAPQWLAIAGHADPVAFAVSELTGLDSSDEQHALGNETHPYINAYCTLRGIRHALIAMDQLYRDVTQTRNFHG